MVCLHRWLPVFLGVKFPTYRSHPHRICAYSVATASSHLQVIFIQEVVPIAHPLASLRRFACLQFDTANLRLSYVSTVAQDQTQSRDMRLTNWLSSPVGVFCTSEKASDGNYSGFIGRASDLYCVLKDGILELASPRTSISGCRYPAPMLLF